MAKPIKIVYIMGCGHSGSTLLDLLLSSHSQVVSVGEVKLIRRRIESKFKSCTCDAPTMLDCPFWGQVDAVMREKSGISLPDIQLDSKDPATFLAHNVALFHAVSAVSGRRIIVDSSKSPGRFRDLYEIGRFEVEPILIARKPQGVVYSNVRKGGGWWEWARSYVALMNEAKEKLRGVPYTVVRYERLAADPAGVVAPLMKKLGLTFEPEQLNWAGRERHNSGGNAMRWSPDSTIRLDTAWVKELPWWQKAAIGVMTWRTAV